MYTFYIKKFNIGRHQMKGTETHQKKGVIHGVNLVSNHPYKTSFVKTCEMSRLTLERFFFF